MPNYFEYMKANMGHLTAVFDTVHPRDLRPGDISGVEEPSYVVLSTPKAQVSRRDGADVIVADVQWIDGGRDQREWPADVDPCVPLLGRVPAA